ncbi:hypothetical protein IWX46DRAFT_591708 [Phyllosticta citricarpa]|uniref:C2H2-type domain-containing protein n=1 Tax=Phyllosticta citricarpa TaxID=55181 RepID=A0ABR1ML93_9PEZI
MSEMVRNKGAKASSHIIGSSPETQSAAKWSQRRHSVCCIKPPVPFPLHRCLPSPSPTSTPRPCAACGFGPALILWLLCLVAGWLIQLYPSFCAECSAAVWSFRSSSYHSATHTCRLSAAKYVNSSAALESTEASDQASKQASCTPTRSYPATAQSCGCARPDISLTYPLPFHPIIYLKKLCSIFSDLPSRYAPWSRQCWLLILYRTAPCHVEVRRRLARNGSCFFSSSTRQLESRRGAIL